MAHLGRIIMYTKRIEEMSDFYRTHFGYTERREPGDRIVELVPDAGGATLLLHAAGKGQKEGQVLVKLVFDVPDVAATRAHLVESGVDVGPIHEADGYDFANLKDPSNNSVQISSRAFRPQA